MSESQVDVAGGAGALVGIPHALTSQEWRSFASRSEDGKLGLLVQAVGHNDHATMAMANARMSDSDPKKFTITDALNVGVMADRCHNEGHVLGADVLYRTALKLLAILPPRWDDPESTASTPLVRRPSSETADDGG